ncbi:MAG: aminodeoxychorismate synthase component I [Deltaproteobacteria bacterium]|nr:MAG: aminodeoxychorismate synthase component I [Deltaproteobacteria bacterium]
MPESIQVEGNKTMQIQHVPLAADPVVIFSQLLTSPYPFWLDSGMDHQKLGRFSFMGADPFYQLISRGEQTTTVDCLKGSRENSRQPFFPLLDGLLSRWRRQKTAGLPFEAGAVGYFGYELGHQIETFPQTTINDLEMPDAFLSFYDALIAIDHLEQKVYLISTGLPVDNSRARTKRAAQRLAWLEEITRRAGTVPEPELPALTFGRQKGSNFSYEGYLEAVEKILAYIAAGDIYQVNLSQRFAVEFAGRPWDFYRRFRHLSPAPFGAYLAADRHIIMSNSPERYLLIKDDYIETRPIKGTRPRGENARADDQLRRELISSRKDQAEHIMIVDLERNDLGRIARYGTVHVPEMEIVESYANVHHLVSTVAARIDPSRSTVDCIVNSFPGGSITGAPKLRSMEIIDELEPTCRGVYTGSIGYLDFSGDIDLNIAIRTAVHHQDTLYFQVGGGIVADSDPRLEYEETITKADSFLKTLGERNQP